jgi:hypothetical protein
MAGDDDYGVCTQAFSILYSGLSLVDPAPTGKVYFSRYSDNRCTDNHLISLRLTFDLSWGTSLCYDRRYAAILDIVFHRASIGFVRLWRRRRRRGLCTHCFSLSRDFFLYASRLIAELCCRSSGCIQWSCPGRREAECGQCHPVGDIGQQPGPVEQPIRQQWTFIQQPTAFRAVGIRSWRTGRGRCSLPCGTQLGESREYYRLLALSLTPEIYPHNSFSGRTTNTCVKLPPRPVSKSRLTTLLSLSTRSMESQRVSLGYIVTTRRTHRRSRRGSNTSGSTGVQS